MGTAVTINLTFQKEERLLLDGREIERNLHKKEDIVESLFNDPVRFNLLKELNDNDSLAGVLLADYAAKRNIYLYTYNNNELVFWGSEKAVPQSDAGLTDGSSLLSADNGWYEAIKKSSGAFSAVALIPIKANYSISNEHLSNEFANDLIRADNLDVASYQDTLVYNIKNNKGNYLLSVKLKDSRKDTLFSKLEFGMWLAALLMLTILVNSLCVWIADRNHIKLSIFLFFLYLLTFRYLDLKTGWLASHFYTEIFNPHYALSFSFPSLGAFLSNIISVTWFVCYVYSYRYSLISKNQEYHKSINLILYLAITFIVFLFAYQAVNVFSDLIQNSSMVFDVSNVLRLNFLNWLGIFALCLVLMNLYFLLEIAFVVSLGLHLSNKSNLLLFLSTITFFAIILYFTDELTSSFFVFSLIILIRAYSFYNKYAFNLAVFISTLLLFACIASIKLAGFMEVKELEAQKSILQDIDAADDSNAVLIFYSIEGNIHKDPIVASYFNGVRNMRQNAFHDYMRKTYFSDYLSKFDFTTEVELSGLEDSTTSGSDKINNYREKIQLGAIKVSNYFYRSGENPASFIYFGLIPITESDTLKGTLLIELNNSRINRYSAFPEVLMSNKFEGELVLDQYSYALYKDESLVYQFGRRVFPTSGVHFPREQKKFINISNNTQDIQSMYRPNSKMLMVISKTKQGLWMQLASLSFLFLVLLSFAILVYVIKWFAQKLKNYDFNLSNLHRLLLRSQNKLLYSTRIQAFVVLIVIVTLVIVGVITFFSIGNQYTLQQQLNAIKQVNRIASGLETEIYVTENNQSPPAFKSELTRLAATNGTDMNLYSAAGELLFSSQHKVYDLGFLAPYMNANAWYNLSTLERSEYSQEEHIGAFKYTAAYAPIKNGRGETVAYLGLPNFSSEKDQHEHFGMLISALFNIYALVIVVLGLFAVFIANRITAPLTLIRKSLSKLSMDQPNEPITWSRNDEIGSLIREYNNMIAALDDSASKIAQSERESAWREMAKQVAHEIKNPLTPLKLGVQLLERSWREDDPKFDLKFERFIHSFIEQIDSLSNIASEFSNFARMPDTKFDKVDLSAIIDRVITVYNNNPEVSIIFKRPKNTRRVDVFGDKDQLLRSFNNLIKNAIEAKTGQGKCMIHVSLSLLESRRSIAVYIRDNGNGIDEEVRDKIFQPNFTTKSSGTGLGLAFVKQTIESMNGTISYETAMGKGTTFFINFPIA